MESIYKLKPRALYAGSFDPFTNGHLYIYQQANQLFDCMVMIAYNPQKKRTFDAVDMKNILWNELNVNAIVYKGLVARYCKENNVQYLVRGLRNTNDYMYEEEIAKANAEIYPELKTIYFRADNNVISSSLVRLFLEHNMDVSKYLSYKI